MCLKLFLNEEDDFNELDRWRYSNGLGKIEPLKTAIADAVKEYTTWFDNMEKLRAINALSKYYRSQFL